MILKNNYQDKLKTVKLFSCINNEDFIKETTSANDETVNNYNYYNSNNTLLNSGLLSNSNKKSPGNIVNHQTIYESMGVSNYNNKRKNEIDIRKLKKFIRKTMFKQNKEESENKRHNIKNSLYSSIKTIKKKEEERKYAIDGSEDLIGNLSNNAITTKFNLILTEKDEDVYSDSSISLLSREKDELVKYKDRRENIKTHEVKSDQNEKFISPITKVDTLGLKLYIKNKLHMQKNHRSANTNDMLNLKK